MLVLLVVVRQTFVAVQCLTLFPCVVSTSLPCPPLHQQYGPDMNRPDETGDTMLTSAVKNNRLDLIQMLLKHGADASISNYYAETALTYARDLCLENDDTILMMLTDAQGDLPWIKYNMKWQIPDDQWNISAKVLHEQRLHHRRSTNKGSLIKMKSQARSKRRLGIPVVVGQTNPSLRLSSAPAVAEADDDVSLVLTATSTTDSVLAQIKQINNDNRLKMKFNIDYGDWFGQGSSTLDSVGSFEKNNIK